MIFNRGSSNYKKEQVQKPTNSEKGKDHELFIRLAKPMHAIQWNGDNTKDVVAFVKKYVHRVESVIATCTFKADDDKTRGHLRICLNDDSTMIDIPINNYIIIDKGRNETYPMTEAAFCEEFSSLYDALTNMEV